MRFEGSLSALCVEELGCAEVALVAPFAVVALVAASEWLAPPPPSEVCSISKSQQGAGELLLRSLLLLANNSNLGDTGWWWLWLLLLLSSRVNDDDGLRERHVGLPFLLLPCFFLVACFSFWLVYMFACRVDYSQCHT